MIHGDRRADRRYDLALGLRFQYEDAGGRTQVGEGVVVDLSRGGVRLSADHPPPNGVSIDVHIDWPFLLQGTCPLELFIRGRVAVADERGTVVTISRYEFRTRGSRSFFEPAPYEATLGISA